jgi:hypothetical protein
MISNTHFLNYCLTLFFLPFSIIGHSIHPSIHPSIYLSIYPKHPTTLNQDDLFFRASTPLYKSSFHQLCIIYIYIYIHLSQLHSYIFKSFYIYLRVFVPFACIIFSMLHFLIYSCIHFLPFFSSVWRTIPNKWKPINTFVIIASKRHISMFHIPLR